MNSLHQIFVFCILLIFIFPLYPAINKDGDFQFWVNEQATIELNEKMQLQCIFEQRYGDDASSLFFYYLQQQLFFEVSNHFIVGPGCREFADNTNAKRQWHQGIQLYTDFIFIGQIKKFSFFQRNRINYIIREKEKPSLEYRNLIQIITPWKISNGNIYFSEEVFIRERRGLFQSRSIIGLEFPISTNFNSNLYYLLRFEESYNKVWNHQNILGLMFRLYF